ncbi:MAG: hypothetical protein M1831_006888 [Alyxoria varia]|nr:MAG: hypothetical protein M1831_006888 [Alyxoria varia]
MRKTVAYLLGLLPAFIIVQTQQDFDHGDATPGTQNAAAATLVKRVNHGENGQDEVDDIDWIREILEQPEESRPKWNDQDNHSWRRRPRSPLSIRTSDSVLQESHEVSALKDLDHSDLFSAYTTDAGRQEQLHEQIGDNGQMMQSPNDLRQLNEKEKEEAGNNGSPSDFTQSFAWQDHSPRLDQLSQYPDASETSQLLDQIQKTFFHRFGIVPNPVVPSTVMEFQFGSDGTGEGATRKYICRLAWQNPNGLSYPSLTNLEDSRVTVEGTSFWARRMNELAHRTHPRLLRRPSLRPTPKFEMSVPDSGSARLTLLQFMEIRFSTRYEGQIWADGMGALLRSQSGDFGFSYRIWINGDTIPRDHKRHDRVYQQKRKGHNSEILRATTEALYKFGQKPRKRRHKNHDVPTSPKLPPMIKAVFALAISFGASVPNLIQLIPSIIFLPEELSSPLLAPHSRDHQNSHTIHSEQRAHRIELAREDLEHDQREGELPERGAHVGPFEGALSGAELDQLSARGNMPTVDG